MSIDRIHAHSHIQSLGRAAAGEGSQQTHRIKQQEAQTHPRDQFELNAAPARSPLFDLIAGKVRESAGPAPRGIVEPQDLPSAINQAALRSTGLEAGDKMGNFEIQRLMSAFNQAETLASNVQKKLDDTVSGQQQKIG